MPASFATTARNALRYMLGTDLLSDVDEGFQRLAEDVDTKMASYSQGTNAARPAAGQPNRFYKVTDFNFLAHDNGTIWEPVWPQLVQRTVTGITSAASGDLCEGTGTLNLPSATAPNKIVGAFSLGSLIVSSAAGGGFYGAGFAGQTSITLGLYQTATFVSDGGNWLVIGGNARGVAPYTALAGIGVGSTHTAPDPTAWYDVKIDFGMGGDSGQPVSAALLVSGVKIAELYLPGDIAGTRQVSNGTAFRFNEHFTLGPGDTWQLIRQSPSGRVEDLNASYRGRA